MQTLHRIVVGFSRVCFEMKGLEGICFFRRNLVKQSSALSAQFSKQKLILEINQVLSWHGIVACENIPLDFV